MSSRSLTSVGLRGGGEQAMTRDQFEALCGEAKAQGLRTMVHAQTNESVRAAVDAGCMQIEHGVGIDDSALKLMAERGVYFDPHVGVVMQNYLRNRLKFLGVADYTEDGFAAMEQVMQAERGDDQKGGRDARTQAGDGIRCRGRRARAQRR